MNRLSTLEQLRRDIEEADVLLIETLAKRQNLSKQIGQLKSSQGKEIIDSAREKKLFEFYATLSEKHHLQKKFIEKVFTLIIAYSKKVQAP